MRLSWDRSGLKHEELVPLNLIPSLLYQQFLLDFSEAVLEVVAGAMETLGRHT